MKNISEEQIKQSGQEIRKRELEVLNEMLNHLREVDRRKLFSKWGYTSLYDYAMKALKYSGDQAHRRISAARLVRELPQIEEKIIDGSLKLTHLCDAQSFFKKAQAGAGKLTTGEKLQILKSLENTTKAEAKKVLKQEDENVRYSFGAHKSFEEVVERLKGLHPHLSFDQLMEKVCNLALEQLNPAEKAKRIRERQITRADKVESVSATRAVKVDGAKSTCAAKVTRYIPATIKREVWLKAQGKCQNCNSTYALEYDHIAPFAKGGKTTKENLRLLCRNCNQRKAIEHFGVNKIEQFRLQ